MLDPLLLRTFLVIAAGHSFSETSRRLELRQSTISDHVRRLEQAVGHQLFLRDTRTVALTREGEALVGFARDILQAQDRAMRRFAGGAMRQPLRCGLAVGVAALLPAWRAFADAHRDVEAELTLAPAGALRAALAGGDLDLAVCERRPGEGEGELLWQDDLVWAGAPPDDGPLPLVLPPAPSVVRALALASLAAGERPWRLACTGVGPDDMAAAAAAGIGVAPLALRRLPAGLREVKNLPALGPLDVVALRGPGAAGSVVDALLAGFRAAAD